ncbi:MAG: hypothetical protein ITG02_05110 [Patulibacter sp.]|nr:hypothetical protein [Patulibacter sp.]
MWFGIRGEDGEALLQLPELAASYAVIAPVRSGRLHRDANVVLEGLSGVRPDLDRYDIDLEPDEYTREFRRRLLREVSGRSVLVTYRPSALVSALAFSMADTLTLAGMFKDRQSAFEHKPWVERSLVERGVADLGWRYVADEHRSRVKRLLEDGPQILRASRTSGGVGIVRVDDEDDVDRFWPTQPDSFVAVAPYLDQAIPVNVSGCVFDDGEVLRHAPSVQLIGVPGCTDRPFGYCGNDFGAVKGLSARAVERLDAMVVAVGRWLHRERYRGAFGLDALIDGDRVLFTEINPRFQGSSALSAELAGELGVPDLFLDHLAAMLGAPGHQTGLSLPEWVSAQPTRSQVVVHNVGSSSLRRAPDATPAPRHVVARFDQMPDSRLELRPGASIGRFIVERSVTIDGTRIDAESTRLVAALQDAHVPAYEPAVVD